MLHFVQKFIGLRWLQDVSVTYCANSKFNHRYALGALWSAGGKGWRISGTQPQQSWGITMRLHLAFKLLAALALLATPLAAQTWDETTNGGGDAGELAGTAQLVGGTGALNEITGNNPTNADRDIYRIRISNAAIFSATTATSPGTNVDTQLRLFTLGGVGIAHNDDRAADFLSTMPAGNALYSGLAAGEYLLAVSSYNNRSNSSTGDIFPNAFGGAIVGPTGAGGANPLSGWNSTSTTDLGTYRVTLTGCEYAAPPGDPEINVRRGTTSIGSGGVDNVGGGAAGTPLNLTYEIQNLGATNPLTVSSIGTQGAPTNCSVSYGTLTPASPVAAAGSATFGVTVTPTATGTFAVTFSVANNDTTGGENPYLVTVTGVVALSGNYNINSSGGGDFISIGAAFDAVETIGVSGPVTLTITDSATYVADATYSLGLNTALSALVPVAGVSATNTITLRAGSGQSPIVQGGTGGAGVSGLTGRGAISLHTSFVIIEGLEITGTAGANFGVVIRGNTGLFPQGNIIRRCRVHGITNGPGIGFMGQNGAFPVDTIFENNFVWDCLTAAVPTAAQMLSGMVGSITIRNVAAGSGGLRHNTIVHNTTVAGTAGVRLDNSSGANALFICDNNIVSVSSATLPALFLVAAAHAPVVANTNFNYWFSTVFCNQATLANFTTLWQTSGRDTNGSNADPQLVSATDLHLQATSPCIDPAGQTSTVTIDIDGNTRPQGATTDIGADEYVPPTSPEIDVYDAPTGGTLLSTPAAITGVNAGPGGANLVYRAENIGTANLTFPGTALTLGSSTGPITVTFTQPTSPVAPAGNTPFTITITATGNGAFTATVNLASNDGDENPYVFNISGTASVNAPPTLALAGTTTFVAGTDFDLTLAPGAALVTADLTFDDVTPDDVVVTITAPGTAPTGITGPTGGTTVAASLPGTLSWTGTADASNAPGTYTWLVSLNDGVTVVNYSVNIIISDVAPTHVGATGQPGTADGSVANPYEAVYTEGMSTPAVDLATVTDANTGQSLSITGTAQTSGPTTGSGFTFTLASGTTLQVAPTAALNANDVGVQIFDVTVSDGTNPMVITVEVTVNGAIVFTSAAALPDATQNTTYAGFTVTATGGTGAITFSITVGALPSGLTLAAGGAVSGGTTAAPANFTFTITATDSLGAITTQAADIDVVAPAGGIPSITTTSPLPAGTVGSVYTTVNFAATGGAGAPYTWALAPASGALPAGLTLGTAGDLTGTPTVAGPFSITVRVTDSASVFADAVFTITINAASSGGGGGGGGGDDDGGGCAVSTSTNWMAMFAVLALLGLAVRMRRVRA